VTVRGSRAAGARFTMAHRSVGGALNSIIQQTTKVVQKSFTATPLSKPKPAVIANFADPEQVHSWRHASDVVIGGLSRCSLAHHKDPDGCREGYTEFAGTLSTATPAGTDLVRSGYCSMRSLATTPSLFGDTYYDLTNMSGLEINLRGDGRTYIANIKTDGMQQEDIFQAFIYTRGGPLWQKVQIPFSDFLLTHAGYVQNEQSHMDIARIEHVGILLADRVDGPFSLCMKSIHGAIFTTEVADMDGGVTDG